MGTPPPPPPRRRPPATPPPVPPAPPPPNDDLIPLADDPPPPPRPARRTAIPTPAPQRPLPAATRAPTLPPPQSVPIDYARKGMLRDQPPARPPGRPGVVITLGVLSILFGVLGVIGNLVAMSMINQVYSSVPTSPAEAALERAKSAGWSVNPPPPGLVPYDGDLKGPNGLGRQERYAIVAAVHAATNLSLDRHLMLDNLLGECGAVLFPTNPPKTPADARRAILELGQLPAGPEGLRTAGTHYFRTPAGAALIDDATARFVSETSAPDVRVDVNTIPAPQGRRTRCHVAVARELDRLRQKCGPDFNPTQAAVLAHWLLAQRLDTYDDEREYSPPEGLSVRLDDATMVDGILYYADLLVLPDGRTISGTHGLYLNAGQPVRPTPTLQRSTESMLTVLGILEAASSAFLLACGIAVFGAWTRAGGGHVLFALTKLALALVGICLVPRVAAEFTAVAAVRGGSAAAAGVSQSSMVAAFVGEMLYPIAILFLVNTASAHDYFARHRPPSGPSLRQRTRTHLAWLDRPVGRTALIAAAAVALLATLAHVITALTGPTGTGLSAALRAALCAAATTILSVAAAATRRPTEGRPA